MSDRGPVGASGPVLLDDERLNEAQVSDSAPFDSTNHTACVQRDYVPDFEVIRPEPKRPTIFPADQGERVAALIAAKQILLGTQGSNGFTTRNEISPNAIIDMARFILTGELA